MGILDFLNQVNINRGLEEYDALPEAVLIDVRSEEEYCDGHIPCSENIPLQRIDEVSRVAIRKDTPLFVYCSGGIRSANAAGALRDMGYRHVRNIGGICLYKGELERGEVKSMCWNGKCCLSSRT